MPPSNSAEISPKMASNCLMVLLFLIKSSPDSEEMKKIKNPAVKQLVNIRISAITSRFIESISTGPFG
jgi:hypothetical protein